jgi:hypothetical protein
MKRLLARSSLAVIALLLASCGGGDKCSPSGPSCSTPTPAGAPTFALVLTAAPDNLGAVVISIEGGGRKTVQLSLDPKVSRTSAVNSNAIAWRAVILGRPSIGRVGTIVLDARGASPTVTVVEAASNAAGGFQRLSDVSTLRFEVVSIS